MVNSSAYNWVAQACGDFIRVIGNTEAGNGSKAVLEIPVDSPWFDALVGPEEIKKLENGEVIGWC